VSEAGPFATLTRISFFSILPSMRYTCYSRRIWHPIVERPRSSELQEIICEPASQLSIAMYLGISPRPQRADDRPVRIDLLIAALIIAPVNAQPLEIETKNTLGFYLDVSQHFDRIPRPLPLPV